MTEAPGETVEQRLRSLLVRVLDGAVDAESITDDVALTRGGLGLDSIVLLRLLNEIEQEFDLDIDDSDMGGELFQNISSLANYIRCQQ